MTRNTWTLLPFVAWAGLVGCSKSEPPVMGGETEDADAGAPKLPPAQIDTMPSHDDPAIRALQEFIEERRTEPDDRGRTIDRTRSNWQVTLPKPPQVEFTEGKRYLLHMQTNHGPVTIRLRPDLAPMHASNALYLSMLGFYDGNASHRANKGFMVQAGAPNGNPMASLGYSLDLEADRRHVYDRPGLMAAARTNDPNSAGSQFFLMFAPYPSLNHQYTIYGELAEEQKVESRVTLAAMEAVANPGNGRPIGDIVFEKVTVSVE